MAKEKSVQVSEKAELTPRQRAEKLAEPRLAKATKAMEQLARLGNRSQYELDDEEREAVAKMIENAAAACCRAIRGQGAARSNGRLFGLPSVSK